jgi:hypothetical protein
MKAGYEWTGLRGYGAERYGLSNTRVYRAWTQMHTRCKSEKSISYPRYGGRGVRVCDRWISFDAFIEDMGFPPTEKHQLDRIAVDGNYEPSNCRWVTHKENSRNKSNNTMLSFGGKTKCVSEWAEELGMKSQTLSRRIHTSKWSIEKALTTPVGRRSR